ncbi:MAG: B12-binding domain-containing radical SAM protein [Sedimentisphaerales bacterium]|nr:B12-binding domain-containing radical SAM protein [Sedimentisphaerales bacterium]
MHICLINPPWLFAERNDLIFSHNLALGSLAGFLRQNTDCRISIIDALAEGFRQHRRQPDGTIKVGLIDEQIIERIHSDVDLIGITVPFSHLAGTAEELCRTIKKHLPDAPIILGGVHTSTSPHLFTQSVADYWLAGEGERALLDLVQGQKPEAIPGLLNQAKPTLAPGERAEMIANLDDLPFPARDLLPMDAYARLSPRRISHTRSASIITSRGCPWNCEFCSIHPMYGHKWRMRSAENVLAEIRELIERYQIAQLEFEDDNLTLHRKRALQIFEGLCRLRKETGVEITWGTPNGIRAETVDKEMLALMKRSGCVRVTYALEHGDADMRATMNKKLDIDKFERAVREAVAAGLWVEVFTMTGYPGETRARFENARAYYRRLRQWGVRTIHVFFPQPYPGTRLYERCRKAGYLLNEDYSLLPPVKIETEDFNTAEVLRRRHELLCEFDRTYRLRRNIKRILPPSFIAALNRLVPRKTM